MFSSGTSTFDGHLDHSFIVFKDVQHSSFLEKNSRLRKQNQLLIIQNAFEAAGCCTVCSFDSQVSQCFAWSSFFDLRLGCQAREFRPCGDLQRET